MLWTVFRQFNANLARSPVFNIGKCYFGACPIILARGVVKRSHGSRVRTDRKCEVTFAIYRISRIDPAGFGVDSFSQFFDREEYLQADLCKKGSALYAAVSSENVIQCQHARSICDVHVFRMQSPSRRVSDQRVITLTLLVGNVHWSSKTIRHGTSL